MTSTAKDVMHHGRLGTLTSETLQIGFHGLCNPENHQKPIKNPDLCIMLVRLIRQLGSVQGCTRYVNMRRAW